MFTLLISQNRLVYGKPLKTMDWKVRSDQKVYYDNKLVSEKKEWGTTIPIHLFFVHEKGEHTTYEVKVKNKWHGFSGDLIIQRNEKVIFKQEYYYLYVHASLRKMYGG